jgi:hypothetical protein
VALAESPVPAVAPGQRPPSLPVARSRSGGENRRRGGVPASLACAAATSHVDPASEGGGRHLGGQHVRGGGHTGGRRPARASVAAEEANGGAGRQGRDPFFYFVNLC